MQCDFSPEHYLECLDMALEQGYKIVPVKDYESVKGNEKYILLRHDVDFSLDYAYEMASMEHSIGHSATYYILLHSTTYNALAPRSMEIIRALHGFGHEVGWQVDSRYQLRNEERILEFMIESNVVSHTQHYFTLTDKPRIGWGINAMDWKKLGVKYISDSTRHWREGCMCKNIGKYNKLEILTHPLWWMSGADTWEEVLAKLQASHNDILSEALDEYGAIVKNYFAELNKQHINESITGSV